MNKKLPIYDIILSDDDLKQGVGMISLVDDPAIKVNWIKLSKQSNLNFKSDKDKQMLYGPFLITNMLIYRNDEHNGEYYVRFSKEEIDKIATKFNEDLNNKNINFMHSDVKVDAFVAQNWLIENEQDKSRGLGFDLPEGTWFGGVKVKDADFWKDKVKSEEVKGFSVEILADLELSLKNKENNMKKLKFASATLQNGTVVYYEGELAVGTAVFLDEAMTEAAPDADHVAEDGTIIVTVDGVVTEIRPMEMRNLAEDGPCWEGYEMVGMKIVDGKEVPNCVPVEGGKPEAATDMAIDPNTGMELPAAITPEEVSMMIDNRFGELMEEITRLKIMIEGNEKGMEEYKKQINEKFSTTPAAQSIKKPETKVDDRFSTAEARIKEFAKHYKK
jgi:hypothetical protein